MKKLYFLSQSVIAKVLLAIWIAFSVIYIANDLWQNFKQDELVRVVNEAYNKAQAELVVQLIQQAQTCEKFPIFIGENSVELIKADCEEQTME